MEKCVYFIDIWGIKDKTIVAFEHRMQRNMIKRNKAFSLALYPFWKEFLEQQSFKIPYLMEKEKWGGQISIILFLILFLFHIMENDLQISVFHISALFFLCPFLSVLLRK